MDRMHAYFAWRVKYNFIIKLLKFYFIIQMMTMIDLRKSIS